MKTKPSCEEPEEELVDYDNVVQDRAFLDNLNDLLQITNGMEESDTGMVEAADEDTPRGLIALIRDNVRYYARKSTILWMMITDQKKLTTDRLRRFIDDSNSGDDKDVKIQLGDFIVMNVDGQEIICQALGFKLLHNRYAFKGLSCPIKHDGGDGVEVQVYQFEQQGNGVFVVQKKQDHYINIEYYMRHVTLKRNNKTDQYTLVSI